MNISNKNKRGLKTPPSPSVARNEILGAIEKNPGIKNNDIARKLGYKFDLGKSHKGWFVRGIVDSLVGAGRVERPNSVKRPKSGSTTKKRGSTECWISGARKK